jgi:guanylate kinase
MEEPTHTKSPLQHLSEFEKILQDYTPLAESLELLQNIPLVLLIGPTAAGRNTLINLLVKTGRYYFIVSDTTRQPRKNNGVMEQNGREYWFKSEEEFLSGLKNGAYLEAAVIHKQQVSGIGMAELMAASRMDKIPVDEIEVAGAHAIHGYKPDALFIFLLPPSFDVWMQRLNDRGDMSTSELRRRLESAEAEITAALVDDFYHFVINNEIHEAAEAVDELANGRTPDVEKQLLGHNHAEQLIIEIKLFLQS